MTFLPCLATGGQLLLMSPSNWKVICDDDVGGHIWREESRGGAEDLERIDIAVINFVTK